MISQTEIKLAAKQVLKDSGSGLFLIVAIFLFLHTTLVNLH